MGESFHKQVDANHFFKDFQVVRSPDDVKQLFVSNEELFGLIPCLEWVLNLHVQGHSCTMWCSTAVHEPC